MSTKRRERVKNHGRGPNGRLLCSCGCGREVQPPRRSWFSQQCVDDWLIKNDPGTVRRKVFERDKGVCAVCGINTDAEFMRRSSSIQLWRWLAVREAERIGMLRYDSYQWVQQQVEQQLRDGGWPDCSRSWWEADHIVPVVEGGGQCGLENYRTLCVPCHKQATRELAQRRAKARQLQFGNN